MKLKDVQEVADQFQTQLEDSERLRQKQQQKCDDLVQQAEQKASLAQRSMEDFRHTVNDYKLKLDELERTKLDLSQDVNLKDIELRGLRGDLVSLQVECDKLQKALDNAKYLAKRLEADKEALFHKMEELRKENRVLTVAKSGLDLEASLSPETIRSYQSETKKLIDSFAKHKEEIENLTKSNNQLVLNCQEYHKLALS